MNIERWNAFITTTAGFILGAVLSGIAYAVISGEIGPKDWLQFHGTLLAGVIGGAMTFAAGLLAWLGVKAQMAKMDELAHKVAERAASLSATYVTCTVTNAEHLRGRLKKISKDRFWLDNAADLQAYFSTEKNYVSGPIRSDIEQHMRLLPVELVPATRRFLVQHERFDQFMGGLHAGYSNKEGRADSGEYVDLIDAELTQLKEYENAFTQSYLRWKHE